MHRRKHWCRRALRIVRRCRRFSAALGIVLADSFGRQAARPIAAVFTAGGAFRDGKSPAQVRKLLARARCFAEKIAPPQVEIFDAVPSRIGGRNRYHLLAQSADFCALDSFLRRWMSAMEAEKFSGVRWSLEINPNFI